MDGLLPSSQENVGVGCAVLARFVPVCCGRRPIRRKSFTVECGMGHMVLTSFAQVCCGRGLGGEAGLEGADLLNYLGVSKG